ncbi:unnamed protein product [Leuciscus chuanchicus]
MTDLGKKRKARIVKKIWVENQKVDLNLSVYLGVLPIFKEYVMVFQESKTLVHKLHDKQLEVFINFLACFIKPEHLKMSPNKLLELDLANNTLHSQFYVRKVAEDLIAAHPKHPIIMDFIGKVTKACTACGKYIQKKLPLESKALSSIDPVVSGHSQAVTQLKELAGFMKHVVPLESDITQEIIRYNVDPNLAKYEDDIVKWWAHVMSLGKYPALSQFIRGALSIFHGPLVESSFSLMGDVIDAKRANMKISTFDAVQTVKYVLRSRGKTGISMFRRDDINMGPVDKTLCQNIRNAGRRDKTDREKRMEATESNLNSTGNSSRHTRELKS